MSRFILYEHQTLTGDLKIQPTPNHNHNDGGVVIVYDGNLNHVIKQWHQFKRPQRVTSDGSESRQNKKE